MSGSARRADDWVVIGQIAVGTRSLVRGRKRAAVTLLVVLTLLMGGWRVLSARGDLRDAEVTLRDAFDVTVTVGASRRAGLSGESLPRGAIVSTGPRGTATLDVRDRLVRLASDTSVGVPDGAGVDLRRGSILVDRRNGPEVTVRAGLLTIDDIDRGGLRVDRGFSTRVSVYSGAARAVTSDRRLDVPRLHVVTMAGRALPDEAAPLRLAGDEWERAVIPEVVAADVTLSRLARGLDTSRPSPGSIEVLPAAYREALADLPPTAGRSEALLPVAIGEAAGGDERIGRARQLRADGASWGVVAALVDARSADVAAELATLIRRAVTPTSGPGSVAAGDPGSGTVDGPDGAPTAGPRATSRPAATRRPSPGSTSQPSSSASPSASPSEGVVDTIRRLLPSETPTPTPPAPSFGGLPRVTPSPVPLIRLR